MEEIAARIRANRAAEEAGGSGVGVGGGGGVTGLSPAAAAAAPAAVAAMARRSAQSARQTPVGTIGRWSLGGGEDTVEQIEENTSQLASDFQESPMGPRSDPCTLRENILGPLERGPASAGGGGGGRTSGRGPISRTESIFAGAGRTLRRTLDVTLEIDGKKLTREVNRINDQFIEAQVVE